MQRGALARNKVSTSVIVTAVGLLLGVLVLAYGHYQSSVVALFAGLLLTTWGVLRGVLQIILHPKE